MRKIKWLPCSYGHMKNTACHQHSGALNICLHVEFAVGGPLVLLEPQFWLMWQRAKGGRVENGIPKIPSLPQFSKILIFMDNQKREEIATPQVKMPSNRKNRGYEPQNAPKPRKIAVRPRTSSSIWLQPAVLLALFGQCGNSE
uniref:Uncharacterized protein n=1 Tax=Eutreptiella gymnastica TaxID=73025 RepID=A0A7S4GD83_9EUGL